MPAFYQAWAGWVNNNGGINGHPVKFYVVDDKNDAATAQAGVKDLIDNKHVVALVGTAESGLESTWASELTAKQVPVVGGYSYTPDWTDNPLFFPSSATVRTAIWSGAFAAKAEGKTTYGVVNCTESAACAAVIPLHKAGAEAAGLKFGYGATASGTAPNYTSNCLAAKNAGVDVLALSTSGANVRFATDCKRQNYEPQYLLAATTINQPILDSPLFDGSLITLTTFPSFLDDPATKDFQTVVGLSKIKAADVNQAEATAWTAVQLFTAAMKSAPASVSSKSVLDGLYTIKDNTLGGLTTPLTFTAADKSREQLCYFTAEIKDKKLTAPNGLTQACIK
ncbi:ABC transporter substrate-binding protein [Jatrophihabitans sp. DSM 45814]